MENNRIKGLICEHCNEILDGNYITFSKSVQRELDWNWPFSKEVAVPNNDIKVSNNDIRIVRTGLCNKCSKWCIFCIVDKKEMYTYCRCDIFPTHVDKVTCTSSGEKKIRVCNKHINRCLCREQKCDLFKGDKDYDVSKGDYINKCIGTCCSMLNFKRVKIKGKHEEFTACHKCATCIRCNSIYEDKIIECYDCKVRVCNGCSIAIFYTGNTYRCKKCFLQTSSIGKAKKKKFLGEYKNRWISAFKELNVPKDFLGDIIDYLP